MMCFACEQDFVWLAYLQSRGLIGPDGRIRPDATFEAIADDAAFAAVPDVPQATQAEEGKPEPADKPKFSCDDPTGG